MSKKISTEARFLAWVDEAPLEVVQSIMGIANSRLKQRIQASKPVDVRKTRADKGTKRTNAHTAMPGVLVAGAES
jgi:hypothetical protein